MMNRPTRVPASTVVKMNNASNMMAKWYQNASSAAPSADDGGEDLAYPNRQRRGALPSGR